MFDWRIVALAAFILYGLYISVDIVYRASVGKSFKWYALILPLYWFAFWITLKI